MIKIKKLGFFFLSALLLAGCSSEIEKDSALETYAYDKNEESYVLENSSLKFTLDPNTTYFEVLDKSSNTIWNSNPTNGAEDPYADNESKKYLQSTIIIEYSNEMGIKALYNNYEYSIIRNVYSIEDGEDYIKVNYSIGDVEQRFNIPTAIPESRMSVFLDKMDSKQQRQINDYYRKIDINKLRPTDNKNELLTKYPDLENEVIYEIREGVQNFLKKKVEDIFEEVGYTSKDLEEDNARYSLGEEKEKPYFNNAVIYSLDDNDLVVEVPFEEMKWRSQYPLTKIKLLPYLGAGGPEEEGFILVPDGNGGIINFNNGKNKQNAYYSEVYGWDAGGKRDAVIDESRTAFPVFGLSKSDSSFLCILEDGRSLASIEADISGRTHSYNYVHASYITLHSASVQVSAKTDKSVMVYEAKKPEGELKQRYRFLKTNSYSKMAVSYREYLMKQYKNLEKNNDNSTPIHISIIGAVDQVKQRFGIPVSVPTPLTTYDEAVDMLIKLKDKGYQNLTIKDSGWMNGGIKQKILNKIKTVSVLGSKKELADLISYGKKLGIPIYLDSTVMYANDSNILDGFIINRDSAKYTSREIIKLHSFSPIYYGIEDWKDNYYLLKPKLTIKYMQNITAYAKQHSAGGVAFNDIGYLLSADYNPKNLTTRSEVLEMHQRELANMASSGISVVVDYGNDYVIPYVELITEMKLKGNQYQIIDYPVPFYSMAIHGLVNYTGNSINLSGDYQTEILKSAETGAGLSFTFMKAPTSYLQNSNYTYYFGAEYDRWKDKVDRIYSRYEAEMGHCFNQYITEHELLDDGVFVSTYEDGTRVFVNYNDDDFIKGNLVVSAHDYTVERR